MKFLVLAYGDEKAWNALTADEQKALIAQDEVLRKRGDLVAAVDPAATTVRAWDGTPKTTKGPVAQSRPRRGRGGAACAALRQDEWA
jgi:hypothetical protein